jgi:ribonuclease D
LIDPLAHVDLGDFWQALTAPGRELIAFAARQELQFCRRFADRLPETLFDPQLAAGLVGFGYPISHTNLVRELFGVSLAGSEAYTDWRRRPLSKQQLVYAADDVRYLLQARDTLLERARTMGRLDWLAAESAELMNTANAPENDSPWLRVGGASRLKPRTLAILRELWTWRDKRARVANLPPKRIMRDDLLIEIAKRSPKQPADLYALRGMDRPALRKEGPQIIAAVQAGWNVPNAELPSNARKPVREDPPQVAVLGQLLAVLTNMVAAEQEIAPTLLATVADLQEFVRWHLGLSDGDPPRVVQGWRGEVLGQALVELLEGRRYIRVVEAASSNPLRLDRFTAD